MKEIIFLFVLFVANVIQAITGFAGTVLAMPPSIYLLGMDNAKVVLNVMALLSGLMIAVMSYHHMNKKEVIKICVCMVAGMAIGIQICKTVPSEQILLVSQVRQGVFTEGNIRLILISIIPLFMATWLGKKLVKKVSQKVFLNLTYVLLLVSGLSLIL